MIPLEYRLRTEVSLEPVSGGTWRVVCESPLTVLAVNSAAARLLESTRYGASVAELAVSCGSSEEHVLRLCEHLRSRGLLDVARAPAGSVQLPRVTVVIPTKDRALELDECLGALDMVDYPADRLEVIVVDDGSVAPAAVAETVSRHGRRLMVNESNRGPSYSRNRAAGEAGGDIFAFIDSDCVAGPGWLRELTPYFCWDRVAAVGGRTVGYHTQSALDRYEEVASPLDMGRHLVVETRGPGTFYVPTCNLLVRRADYQQVGGLREDLVVGEDVDLCWRLRAAGSYLVYSPEGVVRHKHRDRLCALLRRRAEYGTSEAPLHALHPDKRKRFPSAPAPLLTTVLFSAGLITREPRLVAASLLSPLYDIARRSTRLREAGIEIPSRTVWMSVARGHLSMLYFLYFHLVRYYLAPLAAAGLLAPGIRLLTATAALYAAGVDYATRKPRMSYPTYLGYYLMEHLAYQSGVLVGCARAKTWRSYAPARSQSLRESYAQCRSA